jgi:hypothetical protein
MLFKPELLEKVLRGEKTQTRRIQKDNQWWSDGNCVAVVRETPKRNITVWRIGQTYAACPGRGKVQQGRIKIKNIRTDWLTNITEAEARSEGFANRAEFMEAWDKINGAGNRHVMVWILEFELVK